MPDAQKQLNILKVTNPEWFHFLESSFKPTDNLESTKKFPSGRKKIDISEYS